MNGARQPEHKVAVSIRFTPAQWQRLQRRARAEDRSVSNLVTRIVRAELDTMDAREIAE